MHRLLSLFVCLILGFGMLNSVSAAQRVVLCEMAYGEG